MKKQLITVTLILFCLAGFTNKMNAQEITSPEYQEVKNTIEQSIGWAIEKDFDSMFLLWGDDMLDFWLHSGTLVIGLDSFKVRAEEWRDPDFRGTRFEFKDLRIIFSQSGDVAWYSCLIDDCTSYKGKESCQKDVFRTGVLEKRDGRWVHVLGHGSYPIDKIPEEYIRKYYSNLFDKEKS